MMQDYQPIKWYDGYLKETMINTLGLYDDIYMDLTFVDVFQKKGLNAHEVIVYSDKPAITTHP